ncbi:hypothetical protein TMatcc_009918 [Talaromyces marneffei ATCC 18224]
MSTSEILQYNTYKLKDKVIAIFLYNPTRNEYNDTIHHSIRQTHQLLYSKATNSPARLTPPCPQITKFSTYDINIKNSPTAFISIISTTSLNRRHSSGPGTKINTKGIELLEIADRYKIKLATEEGIAAADIKLLTETLERELTVPNLKNASKSYIELVIITFTSTICYVIDKVMPWARPSEWSNLDFTLECKEAVHLACISTCVEQEEATREQVLETRPPSPSETVEAKTALLSELFFPAILEADLADIENISYPKQLPFPEIPRYEIESVVRSTPLDKAPGEDSIPNTFWYKIISIPVVVDTLYWIYNACI